MAAKKKGALGRHTAAVKDPAAVALGRKGGLKGGKALAKKMTAKERSDSARRASRARWDR